jgi:soluble lytic murein transglycosylase-like protein
MAALNAIAGAVLLLAASPARADPVARWWPEMTEASARFGVPIAWIAGVMRAESGGMTELRGRPITSRAGAIGLMQLMPATWKAMRDTYALGPDPSDPHDNILAGTAYLRAMFDRFGYPGLFAAYNAGPARYSASLRMDRPLPIETRAYLAVLTGSQSSKSVPGTLSARDVPTMFVTLDRPSDLTPHSSPSDASEAPDPLFAVRHIR